MHVGDPLPSALKLRGARVQEGDSLPLVMDTGMVICDGSQVRVSTRQVTGTGQYGTGTGANIFPL